MGVKRGLSSVQRTLRACREQGRFVDKCEQYNPYGGARRPDGTPIGVRVDLFQFIDIIAIDTDAIVAIQACSGSGAEHRKSIFENDYAKAWFRAGGKIELWVWRKIKKHRGGKQLVWQPKIEQLTI